MKLEGKSVFCDTEQEYNVVRAIAEAAGYSTFKLHCGWIGESLYGLSDDGEFMSLSYKCEQIPLDQWIWQAEHKDTGKPVAPDWAVVLFGREGGELRFGDGDIRSCSIDGTYLNERHPHSLKEGGWGYIPPDDIISTRPQEAKRLTIDDVIAKYPDWSDSDFGDKWIGFGFSSLTGGIVFYREGNFIDKEEGGCYKICTREEYEARKAELANCKPEVAAKSSDTWYERGELPPVGSECIASFMPNKFINKQNKVSDGLCIIKAYSDNMVWLQWVNGEHFLNRADNFEFKPLPNEEDVVDKAMKIEGTQTDSGGLHRAAYNLIKAGWRPPKED